MAQTVQGNGAGRRTRGQWRWGWGSAGLAVVALGLVLIWAGQGESLSGVGLLLLIGGPAVLTVLARDADIRSARKAGVPYWRLDKSATEIVRDGAGRVGFAIRAVFLLALGIGAMAAVVALIFALVRTA